MKRKLGDMVFLISMVSLLIIFALLALFGLIIGILSISMDHNTQTVETECYDKLGNVIIDQVCEEKLDCNYDWKFLDDFDCKYANSLEDGKK